MTEGWAGSIAPGVTGDITDDDGNLIVRTDNDNAFVAPFAGPFGFGPLSLIQRGVTNGDFALAPLAPDSDITDENVLPYWSYSATADSPQVHSVIDPASASGRALQFSPRSSPDVATTIWQYVPIGCTDGQMLLIPTAVVVTGPVVSVNTSVTLTTQYVTVDGSAVGGVAASLALTLAAIGASTKRTMRIRPTAGAVPATAAGIIVQFQMTSGAGATSGETASLYEMRLEVYRLPVETKVITLASDTIPSTTPTVKLNNTTAGSITLTSVPTIADGVDGQRLLLRNVSAQNVVIQDQGTLAGSNLRLVATTVAFGPRDSAWFEYDSTVGDWVQTTALLNVQ